MVLHGFWIFTFKKQTVFFSRRHPLNNLTTIQLIMSSNQNSHSHLESAAVMTLYLTRSWTTELEMKSWDENDHLVRMKMKIKDEKLVGNEIEDWDDNLGDAEGQEGIERPIQNTVLANPQPSSHVAPSQKPAQFHRFKVLILPSVYPWHPFFFSYPFPSPS